MKSLENVLLFIYEQQKMWWNSKKLMRVVRVYSSKSSYTLIFQWTIKYEMKKNIFF